MSTRVTLIVENSTGQTVKCTDTRCASFDNLNSTTTIPDGEKGTYTSESSDRLFCTFEQEDGNGVWEMGMTCPKSSHNSAQGSAQAGLQTYDQEGTPVTFTYKLGEENEADWDHGNKNDGDHVAYGDCS